MAEDKLMLYVASYDDAQSAMNDFESLQAAEGDDLQVVGSVVIDRDGDGKAHVKESGGGQVGGGAALGAVGGIVVGMFAPPLLLATAVGAGIGAAIGGLVKKHDEKEIGVDVEEYLPINSSAIVAVMDDQYLDRVDSALTGATKKVNQAIDSGDYDQLQKALSQADHDVSDAVDSD